MIRIISKLWDLATPDEPTPAYLAVLMGIAVLVFAAAYVIGPN